MAFPAFAGWETVRILDYGVIEVSQTTNVTMSYSGSISGSNSIVSHRDWHHGTSRYTNNGNSQIKVSYKNTQPYDVPLTCVANCNTGTSCDVSVTRFRFSRSQANIKAGASFDWKIGAQIAIPGPPCQGVFEGTANLETTVAGNTQIAPLGIKIVIGDLPTFAH